MTVAPSSGFPWYVTTPLAGTHLGRFALCLSTLPPQPRVAAMHATVRANRAVRILYGILLGNAGESNEGWSRDQPRSSIRPLDTGHQKSGVTSPPARVPKAPHTP